VTTKLHLAITADGHLIEGFLSAGNVSDITVAESLFTDIYGCHVALDMGYDSDAFRRVLESQNNVPVIPGRKNRKVKIVYDKAIYKLRGRIEQFFGKLKENKRLALRFDKLDSSFLSFIAVASIKILIKSLIN
jgi:transposase